METTRGKFKRKRGVRASRSKLNEALRRAGLPTQIALAQRMAELEQSDQVPKDLVNKVFREQAVEFRSLARIASALDSEIHLLLMSSTEPQTESKIEPEEIKQPKISKKLLSNRQKVQRVVQAPAFKFYLGAFFVMATLLNSAFNAGHEDLSSFFETGERNKNVAIETEHLLDEDSEKADTIKIELEEARVEEDAILVFKSKKIGDSIQLELLSTKKMNDGYPVNAAKDAEVYQTQRRQSYTRGDPRAILISNSAEAAQAF